MKPMRDQYLISSYNINTCTMQKGDENLDGYQLEVSVLT